MSEQALYVVDLPCDLRRSISVHVAELLAPQNLILEFSRGSKRDFQRPTEFSITVASAALRDIHGNRERRPAHLRR